MRRLSEINEGLWSASIKRNNTALVRKEDDIGNFKEIQFIDLPGCSVLWSDRNLELEGGFDRDIVFPKGYRLPSLDEFLELLYEQKTSGSRWLNNMRDENAKLRDLEFPRGNYAMEKRNDRVTFTLYPQKGSYLVEWERFLDTVNWDRPISKIRLVKEKEINEGLWSASIKRNNSDLQRKEDIVKILYHPTTKDELKEIVDKEIEYQGGVNVDLRMIDVSKVKDMSKIFFQCSSLQSLNLSNWDVSNVEDMEFMFNRCSSLQSLDLSNWDVSNVKDMYYMFKNCPIQYKKQGNRLVRI